MHRLLGVNETLETRSALTETLLQDERIRYEAFLNTALANDFVPEHEFRVGRAGEPHTILSMRLRYDRIQNVVHGLAINVTQSHLQSAVATEPVTPVDIGHYHLDIADGLSWWSLATYRLFDMAPTTTVDPRTAAYARIHQDDRDAAIRMLENATRKPGPYGMTFRVVKRDGSIRWVLDRGESFGPMDPETGLLREARGVLLDVTEQPLMNRTAQPELKTMNTILDLVPFGMIQIDANFRIVRLSKGAERALTGAGPVIGRNIEEVLNVLWDETFASDVVARYRHTLETGEAYRSEPTSEKRKNSDAVESYDWVIQRITLPDGSFGAVCHFYDLTPQTNEVIILREDADELREILDNAVAFIGVLDADGTLLEANHPALVAGGLTRADVIGKKFWEADWWSYKAEAAAGLKEAIARARAGETVRYDAEVRMAGNEIMAIDFMLAPIRNAEGGIEKLVASAFDITERKKSEAHIRSLMEEINHRSKNVLTLVQSIARLSGGRAQGDFMAAYEARLQALAASYNLLLEDRNAGVHLKDLITAQLAHVSDGTQSRVSLEGPALKITAEAAQGIGMAIHELATNAAKHGALSGDAGQVEVEWRHGETADTGFVMRWREAGGPVVTAPVRKGFGSTVLGPMVEQALSGQVTLEYPPEGIVWQVACGRECLIA